MITAQEAFYKSIQGAKKVEIPEEIENGILDSCEKGYWFYKFDGRLDLSIVHLLNSLGYTVETCIILGKPVTQISWRND